MTDPPPRARARSESRWAHRTLLVTVVGGALLAVALLWAAVMPGHQKLDAGARPDPAAAVEALREVDGGRDYYARFPRSLPSSADYFPIGVWFESVTSQVGITADKRAGLNLYVALTANSDLRLVARNGMHVIAQIEDWGHREAARRSSAVAGWLLGDEVDMQYRPREGFAEMRRRRRAAPSGDGRLRYANYGKGVTFWNNDRHARRYVNAFQDVVSADNYWFTDRNICGASEGGALIGTGGPLTRKRCHRAPNYGRTVERVRDLVRPRGSRPIWAFVEVGHPFSEDDWPRIRPAEVAAAVWSSIIHGARGIVYFNHSFGGRDQTQHALREPAYARVRRTVTRTNARVGRLAPVLNAPFVDGFAKTRAAVDTMTKRHGQDFYLFAGSRASRGQRAVLRVPCRGTARATVLDEGRTVPVVGGALTDRFSDGNAVHVYRLDGADCRVPTP